MLTSRYFCGNFIYLFILQAWLQPFIAIGHEQPGGGACLLCHHPKGGVATAASHFLPTTHSHTAAAGCHGHKHTECRVPGKAYLHNPHIFKLTLRMVWFCTGEIKKKGVLVLTSSPSLSPLQKIPPNFVNAAELDIPGHTMKDRYKTILPSQWLLCLSVRPSIHPSLLSCLSVNTIFTLVCFICCLDPESRVILRSPEEEAGPDRYINANYIRVRVKCYM